MMASSVAAVRVRVRVGVRTEPSNDNRKAGSNDVLYVRNHSASSSNTTEITLSCIDRCNPN